VIRIKRDGKLRFDEDLSNSDEHEVYCVRINPKLWYKTVKGVPSYTTIKEDIEYFKEDFHAENKARMCGGRVIRCVKVLYYEPIKINYPLSDNELYIIRLNNTNWYCNELKDGDTIKSFTRNVFKATDFKHFEKAKQISKELGGRLYRKSEVYYEDMF